MIDEELKLFDPFEYCKNEKKNAEKLLNTSKIHIYPYKRNPIGKIISNIELIKRELDIFLEEELVVSFRFFFSPIISKIINNVYNIKFHSEVFHLISKSYSIPITIMPIYNVYKEELKKIINSDYRILYLVDFLVKLIYIIPPVSFKKTLRIRRIFNKNGEQEIITFNTLGALYNWLIRVDNIIITNLRKISIVLLKDAKPELRKILKREMIELQSTNDLLEEGIGTLPFSRDVQNIVKDYTTNLTIEYYFEQ